MARKKDKRKVGKPTLYDPKTTVSVTVMYARQGLTDVEIADKLKIHVATLYRWKLRHPEFSEALKSAKDIADSFVEDTLYRRALGYDQTTTMIETNAEGNITKRQAKVVHVIPDVRAITKWLECRQPETWRKPKEDPDAPPPDPTALPEEKVVEYDINKLTVKELEVFQDLLEKIEQ